MSIPLVGLILYIANSCLTWFIHITKSTLSWYSTTYQELSPLVSYKRGARTHFVDKIVVVS
jgi:hypothetical protein